MANKHEIRICGFGGQGIILAGFIIGQAASVYEKKQAVFIQDYGPGVAAESNEFNAYYLFSGFGGFQEKQA